MSNNKSTSIGYLEVKPYIPKNQAQEKFIISKILYPRLRLADQTLQRINSIGKRSVSLSRVRFIVPRVRPKRPPSPHPKDRARVWKKLAEWIQYFVILPHPEIRHKHYQFRVKIQQHVYQAKKKPKPYHWQEEREILHKLRPQYEAIKQKLIQEVGRPTRSDYRRLYPHDYEDIGLSERARRTVRDLKAIFGRDVLLADDTKITQEVIK